MDPAVQVLQVEGDPWEAAAEAEARGATVQVVAGGLIQVHGGEDLGSIPGVQEVRAPWPAHAKESTQGLEVLTASLPARLDGSGCRVAVIDVGYGGATDLLGEELPSNLDLEGQPTATPHGTAVLEIITDFAPDLRFDLYSVSTDVEFLAVIEEVRRSRADLVNASIGFDNTWAADGSSPVSQAVQALKDEGILYVGAAGNEAENYLSGAITDEDDDGVLELDGAEDIFARPDAGAVDLTLRLADPAQAITLSAEGCTARVDRGVQTLDCAATEPLRLTLSGDAGGEAWLWSRGGVAPFTEGGTTLSLPGDAAWGITVGAYGVGTEERSWFSSTGPTEDGRIKPDLLGPSGVDTVTWPAFEGSSAATPHVTGLAALLLDRGLSPEEVRAALRDQALDIGPAGEDAESGAGLARLSELPPRCGSVLPLPLLGLLGLRRRRP